MLAAASSQSSVLFVTILLTIMANVRCFQVAISDADLLRQTCSGMWKGSDTRIEISFDKGSEGTVSTLFYEFSDFPTIGKDSKEHDILGFPIKTYICTTQAVLENLCKSEDLGNFIISGNASSVMTKRVDLGSDPQKNIARYNVTSKGYYCVGATSVPMTTQGDTRDLHSHFTGRINFINSFHGELPATEYPKLQFYFALATLYVLVGVYWAYLCISHKDELLTVQHFISGTIGLLILGNVVQWLYLRYLNTHTLNFWTISSLEGNKGVTFSARTLLVLSSILDAARNSTSLFLLLIVSMGYGVVRPTIGPVMTRVRILTAVHFFCGVLYSIGIVLIVTETGGGWIFLFIFPLGFTLTAFMMWTLHSLNATIEYLTNRKQTFKSQLFRKLHRILLFAVVAIFAFFIITSIAFSQSSSEDFSPSVWPYRWFLLDGWMGILYLCVFSSIAWLWRPTGQNLRLSMSDEIGQDEGYAGEDYEIGEFGQHGDRDDDEENSIERGEAKPTRTAQDNATSTGRQSSSATGRSGHTELQGDDVVFEIGDDDDESPKRKDNRPRGSEHEQESLISGGENMENDSRETLVPQGGSRDH